MHDYKLAEEYCDGMYEESNSGAIHGMHQLPTSLRSRLQGVANQGWGAPGEPGSNMYLLLIQVEHTMPRLQWCITAFAFIHYLVLVDTFTVLVTKVCQPYLFS